jgi:hypothetical protein
MTREALTWYRLARPSKIARGIDFQIRSSTPSTAIFSGFVWPNPFPKEHSPILSGHGQLLKIKLESENLHVKSNIVQVFHEIALDPTLSEMISIQGSFILLNQIPNTIFEKQLKLINVSRRESW